MHSISPYTIRVSKKHSRGDNKYLDLHEINFLDVLSNFVSSHSTTIVDFNSKQTCIFDTANCDADSSVDSINKLYGILSVGFHGITSDIIDYDGVIKHKKKTTEAEMIGHYFQFYLRKDSCDEGLCAFYNFRTHGIKSLFEKLLNDYLDSHSFDWKISIKPLADQNAFIEWTNKASVRKIVVTKFNALNDPTDDLKSDVFGHFEKPTVVLELKKPWLFKSLCTTGSDELKAIELLKPLGEQIKTVVKLNGKDRTFRIGNSLENSICQIELDSAVVVIDDVPDFGSLHRWVNDILDAFMRDLYRV